MTREMYDSLTPMERNCLRLAHHDRKTEQIAHELGISASTVNTHIFSARRKLGGIPRLTAADQLRLLESEMEPGATGLDGRSRSDNQEAETCDGHVGVEAPQSISRQGMPMAGSIRTGAEVSHPAVVREVRTAFVFDDDRFAPSGGEEVPHDDVLRRVALILAIALLMALVAIAAPAIYDSAAVRIANSLEQPHLR